MPKIPDPTIGTIQCTQGKVVQANMKRPIGTSTALQVSTSAIYKP